MSKHRNPQARLSNPEPHDNQPNGASTTEPDAAPEPDAPEYVDEECAEPFDVAQEFGSLQSGIGLVDSLIYATERHLERFGWCCRDEGDAGDDPLRHLANLLTAARIASRSMVMRSEAFAGELVKNYRRWDA